MPIGIGGITALLGPVAKTIQQISGDKSKNVQAKEATKQLQIQKSMPPAYYSPPQPRGFSQDYGFSGGENNRNSPPVTNESKLPWWGWALGAAGALLLVLVVTSK